MSDVDQEPPAIAESAGSTIGPYKLLQRLGEGGMGVVFMAEQQQPIRRLVALKVIRPGMGTDQVIARFEAERQALAIMDHPHIAKVLDVGSTTSGRPFFVMELVRGEPITEYCDKNHLSPVERLKLFIPVCQAIQHAHQKGIIHRDIKPSNVLVTLHDGVPEPKVIDFGVAKAIEYRLTDRTLFTRFGDIIGTLEYMSPEQAEMGKLDIDTRSDVYSLGVLLYELLTGSTPLERSTLRKALHAEVLRILREVEPPKPSTRLSESHEAMTSLSVQRSTEPARLSRMMRGDIDWIVMKSLEKDRTRRYDTAIGMARDIQRYLDGDAVEASPPTMLYKVKKFARKHRVAFATAGSFAAMLMAATVACASLAYWATEESNRATLLKTRAVAAECLAADQRDRARQGEEMAIDAVRRYGDMVRDTPELKRNPALEPLRRHLLKEPQSFFEKLRDRLQEDRGTTSESLARLATACFELGRLTEDSGDRADALQAYEQSRQVRERLALDNPANLQRQIALISSENQVAAIRNHLRQPTEAMKSYRRAVELAERLALEHPQNAELASMIGHTWKSMASIDLAQRRYADAIDKLRQAVAAEREALKRNPARFDDRSFLASCLHDLAELARWMDLHSQAEEARREQAELDSLDPEKSALDAQLAGVIGGQSVVDNSERVKLARRAAERSLNATSARLFGEALRIDGEPEADSHCDITYDCIRSAALAGCGQGLDHPPTDLDARACLRHRALQRLWSEAEALSGRIDTKGVGSNSERIKILDRWVSDPALLGLRDETWLKKWPEDEQQELRRFWAEVDLLRARTALTP